MRGLVATTSSIVPEEAVGASENETVRAMVRRMMEEEGQTVVERLVRE